jgi:hypothetical protein
VVTEKQYGIGKRIAITWVDKANIRESGLSTYMRESERFLQHGRRATKESLGIG